MNLRAEYRHKVEQPVTVAALDDGAQWAAVVLDVSRSGLCLQCAQAIAKGRLIEVKWDGHFLVGVPRYLKAAEGGFQIGVQLLVCSSWNEERLAAAVGANAAPEHAITLDEALRKCGPKRGFSWDRLRQSALRLLIGNLPADRRRVTVERIERALAG